MIVDRCERDIVDSFLNTIGDLQLLPQTLMYRGWQAVDWDGDHPVKWKITISLADGAKFDC